MIIIGRYIKSNKHIAIVTPGFPKNEKDSTCIPALQLFVKELIKKEIEVTVFSLHYPFSAVEYKWNGIEVVPLNGRNRFFVRKFFLLNRLRRAFLRKNTTKKIDLIHSFWLNETTFFSSKLADEFNIDIIASAQGQDVLKENEYLKKLPWQSMKVYCMSDFQKNQLLRSISAKVSIISWGVSNPILMEKEFDLIGVGNLIPLKNFTYFIELCKNLKEYKPEFKAKIIGKGIEKDKLLRLINNFNLDKNVELVGELSYKETQALIAKAKVLVHPSTYEGFGMVLIEALAYKTHVLSSPVGFAFECSDIKKIKFNIESDTMRVLELLKNTDAKQKLLKISDTVENYLKIYEE